MAIARITFETFGICRYPTVDRRQLQIRSSLITGDLSFRFEFRETRDDLPTDVIACDFRIAANDGRLWSATSRFTSEIFVTHMFDISLPESKSLFSTIDADPEFHEAFRSCPLLSDVRYSSDDRFHRRLLVGDKVRVVPFKYTMATFDVAAVQDPDALALLTKLAIKIRAGSLFDHDGNDIGEVGYFMSCKHPLRNNTAAFDEAEQMWRDNPIPEPMAFSATEDFGVPNEEVAIVA